MPLGVIDELDEHASELGIGIWMIDSGDCLGSMQTVVMQLIDVHDCDSGIWNHRDLVLIIRCLLYTSPSPRD